MTQEDLPEAVSMSVVYNPAEDRLVFVLTSADKTQWTMMVTRRFTTRLIDGIAQLLDRTNPTAQEAPDRVRSDIIMFEHQTALGTSPKSRSEPSPDTKRAASSSPPKVAKPQEASTHLSSRLMDAVDIKILPKSVILTLMSGGNGTGCMELNRGELHRLLALLRRKCDEADWRVVNQTKWLDLGTGSLTLN